MQKLDIQDVVKTAYENAAKFIYSYNMYWDVNNVVAASRLEAVNFAAGCYKDFLLKDDTVSYEYKKTALQMATEHFCSLQDRLMVNVLRPNSEGEERRKGLDQYIKDMGKMRTNILSNASEIVLQMTKMEKKITTELEKEVIASQKSKSIRKVK